MTTRLRDRLTNAILAIVLAASIAGIAYLDQRDAARGMTPACIEAGRCPVELGR